MSTVQTIIIILASIVFFGRLFFGIFKRFTPFSLNKTISSDQTDLTNDYIISNLEINNSNDNNNNSSDTGNATSGEEATTSNGTKQEIKEIKITGNVKPKIVGMQSVKKFTYFANRIILS